MKRKEREEGASASAKKVRLHVLAGLDVELWKYIIAEFTPYPYWVAVSSTCSAMHGWVKELPVTRITTGVLMQAEPPVSFLDWFVPQYIMESPDMCRLAAQYGRLDILQWTRSKNPHYAWGRYTCECAAGGGYLEILQWLRAQDPPCTWDARTCSLAAQGGHMEVLEWAATHGCPWNCYIFIYAAQEGHVDILQWATDHGVPQIGDDRLLPVYAAEQGRVESLIWAKDHGYLIDKYIYQRAAKYGHLPVIQWLRAQDPPYPWDSWTCAYAAKGGHLDVIKWAREHGCPWDVFTRTHAAKHNRTKVLEWAEEHNCPKAPSYSSGTVELVHV